MKTKILGVVVCLVLLGLLVGVGGCGITQRCPCLYSGMESMEVLGGESWDIDNPDAGDWGPVNTIPQDDADASDWGIRFPKIPWSEMYDDCANWVYGNTDWEHPVNNDHEYYRLPLKVTAEGGCQMLLFQAYVDDGAKFYIDGPGFDGPTLFHEHDPADAMYSDVPDTFWLILGGEKPVCLSPGDYTIYIDHWDAGGVIYGLIFTAWCFSCECPEGPSIDVEKSVSVDGGETWADSAEQTMCQNVMFKIIVTNDGGVPLTDIVINDTMPDCLEYVDGPAVEVCRTQASESPYYNLAGTHTPIWKCTSGLQPNDSIEVVFNAHVVCAEDCCNVVSVAGSYGEQVVSDLDCAVVAGVCDEETVTLTVCECDDFAANGESPSPSKLLLDWIDVNYATRDGEINPDLQGSRDCDETGANQYWAHTFTELEPPCGCHIIAATLEITLKNDDEAHDNDHLKVGCISSASDVWEINHDLTFFDVQVGEVETITLNLGDVYGDGTTSILDVIESEGFLDVAVDDDSPVDCAVLTVTYGS